MTKASGLETTETRQPTPRRKIPAVVFFLGGAVIIALCILYGDTAFEMIDHPLEALPGVQWVAHAATAAGGRVGGAIIAIAVIAMTGRYWKRAGLTILCGTAVQTGLTDLIKHMAGRPRPDEFDGVTVFFGPGAGYNSFPSGHASFAFMLATVAAAYFPRRRWLCYGLALLVAAARVMLDRHFLSDVTVGGLIGFAAAQIFLRIWPPPHHTADQSAYDSTRKQQARM